MGLEVSGGIDYHSTACIEVTRGAHVSSGRPIVKCTNDTYVYLSGMGIFPLSTNPAYHTVKHPAKGSPASV